MATKKKLLEAAAGAAGGAGLNVEEVFSNYVYLGNSSGSSTQTITNGIDLSGEGGLLWTKPRTSGTYTSFGHGLMDTERGIDKILKSNATDSETTISDWAVSFNSDGFTLDGSGYVNETSVKYASWTFRKAPKFFDVVQFVGDRTSGNLTVNHNLGSVPGVIIVKCMDDAQSWTVYHRSEGANRAGFLNSTNAFGALTDFPSTPTSTQFTVGTDSRVNFTGRNYIAYLFAHNDGDGGFGPDGNADIIKCGSYTGNGSSTGPEIDLGFEPQWLLLKNATDSGNSWALLDVIRGLPAVNQNEKYLFAQANWLEDNTVGKYIGPTSTGFNVTNSGTFLNASGSKIIYIAIRRGPMAVPEDATEVFDDNIYNATGAAGNPQTTGFPVDLAIIGQRFATDSWKHGVLTRLTGAVDYLVTSDSLAEQNAGGGLNIDNMTGYNFQSGAFNTASPAGMYNLNWRRAPSFFDVVHYTGNGTVNHQISHNLQAVPELLLFKPRGSGSWIVKSKFDDDASGVSTRTNYLLLNFTNAYSTSADYRLSSDETSFTLSTNGGFDNGAGWNTSASEYIAYLFASADGVSKVGSFTGNGTTINIDCGFSSSARFVMTKRTDAGSDWVVWDAARGIVAGNDPYLVFNDINAENNSYDSIDPYSSGFSLNYDGVATNISGAEYIFYAVA